MTDREISHPAILVWGRMMGSFDSYIEHQLALAQADGAPRLATYKRERGVWRTLDEVTSPSTQLYFKLHAPELAKEAGFT